MSYHHANVALSSSQINKLKSKQASASGTSITLKHGQLSRGKNKLSVTQTLLNQIAKARSAGKGIRLDFTATAVRDMIKSGGIFPLLAAIAALIAASAPAVAKAAALGAVETAAGMALKTVTGKWYRKRGGNISAVFPALISALAKSVFSRSDVRRMFPLAAAFSGSGYKKKGRGLRLP